MAHPFQRSRVSSALFHNGNQSDNWFLEIGLDASSSKLPVDHDEAVARLSCRKDPSMLITNAKWSCHGDEAQTAADLEAAGCVVLVYAGQHSPWILTSINDPWRTDARKTASTTRRVAHYIEMRLRVAECMSCLIWDLPGAQIITL